MPASNPRGRAGGGPGRPLGFHSPHIAWSTPPSISGITKDSAGTVLGSCTVKLYATATDLVLQSAISDPSTGAYTFYLALNIPCYVVAYKVGAPDVAGTTVKTLVSA